MSEQGELFVAELSTGLFVVADLYTGYLFLTDLLNSVQGDCSIRMTALLEYLDLALATPSWILCYNSVTLSLILLHH